MGTTSHQTADHNEPIVRPSFIFGCFLIMNCIFWSFAWVSFSTYRPVDNEYKPLTPLSTPAISQLSANPEQVDIGLIIDDFQKFDIYDNDFLFNGILWIAFNPNIVPFEAIDQIALVNGTFVEKSKASVTAVGDKAFARYAVKIAFRNTSITYKTFPADDHILHLIVTYYGTMAGDVIFKAARSNLVINDDLTPMGWGLINTQVASGYLKNTIKTESGNVNATTPGVIFYLYCQKISLSSLLTLILPLVIFFLMGLYSFAIPYSSATARLSLTAQSIIAIVAFRFVIETISPKTGYFLVSDYFFLLFLLVSIIVFFVNLTVHDSKILQYIFVAGINLVVAIGGSYIWLLS